MSSITEGDIIQTWGNSLMLNAFTFAVSHVVKSEGIERVGIVILSLMENVNGDEHDRNVTGFAPRHGDACMPQHQWLSQLGQSSHPKMWNLWGLCDYWRLRVKITAFSFMKIIKRVQVYKLPPPPENRNVSFRKLSSLRIFPTPSFVQPDSSTMASTSSRRGTTSSGCAASWYSALQKACWSLEPIITHSVENSYSALYNILVKKHDTRTSYTLWYEWQQLRWREFALSGQTLHAVQPLPRLAATIWDHSSSPRFPPWSSKT